MKNLIIYLAIFITGLIVYWILGAYFLWDLGWLKTMSTVSENDRVYRLIYYFCVQVLCILPYSLLFDN